MGNITGNQDRARFISYADSSVAFSEDAKLAGWTREISNRSEVGFDRLKSLMVFLMTTPGIPCIYYGDEIGLPGANDPDNRRMMLFEELDSSQQSMLELTQRIIKLRRGSMALNYGSTEIIESSSDRLVYTRKYMGEEVMVIFRKAGSTEIEIETDRHWQSTFGGKLRHLKEDHLEKVNGVVVSVKDFEVLVSV
jgi:glycosidase